MPLHTERLILRPWRDTDAVDLYEYARDLRVGSIAGWPAHTSVEESGEIIRTVFNRPEVYALQSREDGRAIGCVGILIGADSNFEIGEREGEIAYWIGVPYWGRGLVPEAVREVMRHAFLGLRLDALWCGYFADNLQSLSVQSKCGFQHHHTEVNKFNSFLGDTTPNTSAASPASNGRRNRLPCCARDHHSAGTVLHEQQFRRRSVFHRLKAQVAVQGHRRDVVTIDTQGQPLRPGRLQRLRHQRLHQYTSQSTPACPRRNDDAAQVQRAGGRWPVLAETKAVAMRIQQHPTRALLQLQCVRECIGRERIQHSRTGPALGCAGRIQPRTDDGVVRGLHGAKVLTHGVRARKDGRHGARSRWPTHVARQRLNFVPGQ